jgi:hypothetical protein
MDKSLQAIHTRQMKNNCTRNTLTGETRGPQPKAKKEFATATQRGEAAIKTPKTGSHNRGAEHAEIFISNSVCAGDAL